MKIYVRNKNEVSISSYQYPSILLVRNSWDDYGYKSLFTAYYQGLKYEREPIGDVKILYKGKLTPVLRKVTEHLPAATCSLGQNLNYYRQAKKLLGVQYRNYLEVMNDLTFLPGLYDEFKLEKGFRDSLLRDKDAQIAFKQADKIHLSSDIDDRNFEFKIKLKGASRPHKVDFNFHLDNDSPGRLIAIIGKNGTGKTQFISKLATSLGKEKSKWEREINFPHFNRVIAISFSPFDVFKIPEKTRRYNYVYCGVRDPESKSLRNKRKHLNNLKSTVREIINENKNIKWYKLLETVLDKDSLDIFYDQYIVTEDEKLLPGISNLVSSGQLAQVIVYSELLAKLRPRSLLLYDEPEIHLHPTVLSHLIRSLHNLMEEYDSVGIICTHSPIVIQEIPSRNVFIFERKGNIPIIRKPEFESFGENLTNITEAIFDTIEIEANYKKVFQEMIKEGKTMEEIESVYDGRLSFNARTYLASISEQKKR